MTYIRRVYELINEIPLFLAQVSHKVIIHLSILIKTQIKIQGKINNKQGPNINRRCRK